MKKRFCALSITMIMTACSLTACTGKNNGASGSGEPVATAPATENAQTSEAVEEPVITSVDAPITEGWDESRKIFIYSWNDDLKVRLDMVLAKYPQYRDYCEYIDLNMSGTDEDYVKAIEEAMKNSDKYPSIIPSDDALTASFTESGEVLSMDELGITADMYSGAYRYTIERASYNGNLMALTWQATPGCFVYRTDIAELVLGSSDPQTVQEAVNDWDAFFATADRIKASGYKMLSGPDDISYAALDQQTDPWITVSADGTELLSLDDSISSYFENSKRLYDGGYTDRTVMGDSDWSANFEDDVFGYFGYPEFVYNSIATTEDSEKSTFGKWSICRGPVSFHKGGTYLCVGRETSNPALCRFLLYELCCDKDMMYEISAKTSDFVNNSEAMEQILADGAGKAPVLGECDPVEIWLAAAPEISLDNGSYLDGSLKEIAIRTAAEYNSGGFKSVEDAVEHVKEEAGKTHPQLMVD